MEGLVKLIGIVIVAAGVIYFVKPNLMKKMADFFTKDKWIYFGGILSFVIGIIFLASASLCAIPWFVILIGLIAIIKGIAIFALGQQKIKSLMETLLKKPPKTLRILALVDIALGVMLIYAV
jgi:uncharacterized protein YjeT (DUF2065 family)